MKALKWVYVASPVTATTPEAIKANMNACDIYMQYITKNSETHKAMALHHVLPTIFDDRSKEERSLVLLYGIQLLERCSAVLVCGDFISSGMRGEIESAIKFRKPIVIFNYHVYRYFMKHYSSILAHSLVSYVDDVFLATASQKVGKKHE